MTIAEILKQKERKMNMPFPVKSNGLDLQVKDVDRTTRTVQFSGNTYYWLDSDLDILIDGASKKSIKDRGPQSQAKAKIKHLADHVMMTNKSVSKLTLVEEKTIDDRSVLYFEGKIPNTTDGDDHLIRYQEGIYDNHSIGFRYKDIGLAVKEGEDEDQRKRWDEFYPQILNKEIADESGYFWVVKEIELYEVSTVMFGANSQTEVYGFKSKNKETVLLELHKRMDLLQKQLRNGTVSDDSMLDFELQIAQIKQIMMEVMEAEPSIKDTILEKEKPFGKDTKKLDYDYMIRKL